MSGGDFDRLERALDLFAAWEAAGMSPPASELLAANEDLREVLEPLIQDAQHTVQVETETETVPYTTQELAPSNPHAPIVIDGFRIEYELGRGGMGIVYAARQIALDRPVALKVLLAGSPLEARAVARFRRESSLLAALDHPSLVDVITVGRDQGHEYFAMELVDGVPLNRVIGDLGANLPEGGDGTRFGSTVDALLSQTDHHRHRQTAYDSKSAATSEQPIGPQTSWSRNYFETVTRIVWQIADALAHAHGAGVLHRDVKPSNILIRRDGRAVLTDFGLAREVGRPSLTQSGEFAGTVYYAAPEQVLGRSSDLDGRADVFALGVVLYEMLLLRRPFEGSNNHDIAHAVLQTDPPDPTSIHRRIPSELSAIALRAIEKAPRRRYQTARELADDLDAFLNHRPVHARRAGLLRRMQRFAQREPWQAALVIVLCLAVPAITFLGGYLQARAPILAAGEAELRSQRIDKLLEQATMKLELGDQDTMALLQQAAALDPGHPDTIGIIVWARSEQGPALSLDELEQLIEPADLVADEQLRLRAWVLAQLGRKEEAAAIEAELAPVSTAVGAFYSGLNWLSRGHSKRDEAAFRAAADGFEVAALMTPRRRPLYLNKLAHALGHVGDATRREKIAAVLHRSWPDSASQQYWSYFAEKDSNRARARTRLQRALQLRRDHAVLLYNLGVSYSKSKQYQKAVAPLEQAIARNPNFAAAHANLALAWFHTGKHAEALASVDKAIALDHNNADLHANRGQFLLAMKRVPEARQAHEQALSLEPAQPIALAGVAYLLHSTQGATACATFCREQLDQGRVCEELYRFLVMSRTQERRYQDAVKAADEGLALFGDSAWLHIRRAHAIKHLDRAAAIADGRRAVELAPTLAEAHETKGQMLSHGTASPELLEESLVAFEQQIQLAPGTGKAYLNAAVVLMRLGRSDESLEKMRQVVARVPTWARGHENLGALLLDLGHLDQAIAALDAGLQQAPTNPGIRFRYAFALHRLATDQQRQSKLAEARASAQQGLELLSGRTDAAANRLRSQLSGLLSDGR